MKKLLILSIFVLCVVISLPGALMAASGSISWSASSNPVTNLDSFQLSKNVTICYNLANETYAIIASHLQGNNLYGGAAGDSAVYVNRSGKNEGTAYTTAPTASDSGAFSSWTPL